MPYSKAGATAAQRLFVDSGMGERGDRRFSQFLDEQVPPITTQAQWNTWVNEATKASNNPGVDPRLRAVLEFIVKNHFDFPPDPNP